MGWLSRLLSCASNACGALRCFWYLLGKYFLIESKYRSDLLILLCVRFFVASSFFVQLFLLFDFPTGNYTTVFRATYSYVAIHVSVSVPQFVALSSFTHPSVCIPPSTGGPLTERGQFMLSLCLTSVYWVCMFLSVLLAFVEILFCESLAASVLVRTFSLTYV